MVEMGDLGGMGFISSEVSLFSSEQNKNISTLIENSSELNFFCSELFFFFGSLGVNGDNGFDGANGLKGNNGDLMGDNGNLFGVIF